MEVSVGGLLFTSNFDSGNLAKVERVYKDDTKDCSSVSNNANRNSELQPDLEYNVWTRPDCSNTIYENGNRSWFYFGVEGGLPGQMIKINIMNMNRQGKLYSQGYCPVIYTVPGSNKWERLQDKPAFDTVDGQFILSFCHRFTEMKGATTYFAFAYPHSYIECQNNINELEQRFSYCKNISSVENIAEDTVYFYRELLCYSLEKLEVSLITISSFHNIIDEEEPHFDPKLFPIKTQPRCKKFKEKRVFVLTSRVHPGETPSSFVFNGFLNFILRLDDPRSIQLRKQFVFKLIPILNPDGVMNGHYRTDTRGVNLNRVYGDPSFELNPSIYAAKSIIIYYHVNYRLKKDLYKDIKFPPTDILPKQTDTISTTTTTNNTNVTKATDTNSVIKFPEIANIGLCRITQSLHTARSGLSHRDLTYKACLFASRYKCRNLYNGDLPKRPHSFSTYDRVTRNKLNICSSQTAKSINLCSQTSGSRSDSEDSSDPKGIKNGSLNKDYLAKAEERALAIDSELTMHLESLRISNSTNSEITQTDACRIHSESVECDCKSEGERTNSRNDGSDEDQDRFRTSPPNNLPSSAHLNNSAFRRILPQHSGIAFYIDLHGHASRKGCFIYGNFLEADDSQIQNMLYPKLVSLNSAHFEFDACNFSQRNMYIRDKRDGLSKEGSGRVAIHKCTGIIHSYTLECNYNTGKVMNVIPPAHGDRGRASPTPIVGTPPKYTPSIYEDVGQAIAVAALDMYETNPWSRVTLSEYKNLYGTREWLRKYCLIPKGFLRPKNYKPPLRTHSFSHFSSSRSKINSNDSILLNPFSTSETISKPLNSGKKELRPLKDVSSRLTSCSRKCNSMNNKKGEESTMSETKVSCSFTLPNSTESPSLASLRSARLHHNKVNPISYVCSESTPKHTSKLASRNKPIDSKLQRAKSDISKSSSISPAIFSKPVKGNSLYDKKDVVKTSLNRSVSNVGEKQRSLLHISHNHTWSAEGPFHNKLMFKSRRHVSSSTSMPRKKAEIVRGDGSLSSFHLKSKEEFSSEATNDVQRNMPPKKKRKYSLFKRKPAVNSLRSNTITRSHLKIERRDNTAHEKLPHKRKVSWRILPHSNSQQFTKTNSHYRYSENKAATFQRFVNLSFSNVNRLPFQIEGCSLRNCSKSTKEPEVPS